MATSFREAKEKEFKFWKPKPVIKIGDHPVRSHQIKTDVQIRSKYAKDNETKLPDNFEWERIEISDDRLESVADFLNDNYRSGYVSSIDVDKIRWETMGKGFFICIKQIDEGIVGCVGLTERVVQINSDTKTVCEPIYLCCQSDIRGVGMAKVMINELIRQSALEGYGVGSFYTDAIVPSPIATIRYYTRPLNYKHLKANEFVSVGDIDDDVAHDRIKIKLKPPKNIYVAEKTDENIKLVSKLYNDYMMSFNFHHVLSLEEVENYFFDSRYVRTVFFENEKGKVVDFLCYRFYPIINTNRDVSPDDKYGNIINATTIFMYSSNYIRADILIINAFKVISRERHHLVYVPDMMGSNEAILSPVKKGDEDTLDEEDNALYDQHMVKSRKKQFINLFNWSSPTMTQEMISYLIFN